MTIGSVDGLISGMSTTDIINQLVSAEASGQTALKSRATTAQKTVSAMQSINTKLAALGTAADALTTYRAFAPVSATSSSEAVTATASPGAHSGSLTFDVKKLAAAEIHATDNAYALTDAVAGASIRISKGGVDTPVATGDGRLETVVARRSTAPVPAYAPLRYRSRPASTSSSSPRPRPVRGRTSRSPASPCPPASWRAAPTPSCTSARPPAATTSPPAPTPSATSSQG